ncbi:hypothetical protein ElyMa_004535400 [Elysia marginata]|uniref:Uncharacterized protein n=1 Tax=Elysia marginata TaxID=1093978 RepID=A0AAV4HNE2_9GAST|nr:hypothetical protein ElyMa_004535400 [Elysia marginata]
MLAGLTPVLFIDQWEFSRLEVVSELGVNGSIRIANQWFFTQINMELRSLSLLAYEDLEKEEGENNNVSKRWRRTEEKEEEEEEKEEEEEEKEEEDKE